MPTHPASEPVRFCQLRKDYFNDVIEILDRASSNTSLVLLDYEPVIRQFISTTMLSSRSLRPQVYRHDHSMPTRIEKALIHAVVEHGQWLRADEMSPSPQGSATWNRLRIDATELVQPQAIGPRMRDLLVVPASQAPHHYMLNALS